jgi:two-component system response regulator AtoC
MDAVTAMVDRVADSDIGVLLRGESGVGKDVIARELHRRSPRRARPFVKVNCAALPAELLESELFGHERGSFTGASGTRVRKFACAQNGTILLDEITEMPLPLQAKLLHVLQDRQITRVGSNRTVEVDARVLAATNRVIEDVIRAGAFREDLYYRLQVIELRIPPMRERQDEIAPLVEFFLSKFAGLYRRSRLRASPALMRALQDYHWPGNIRELENMLKRYVVLQDEGVVLTELARLTAAPRPRMGTTGITGTTGSTGAAGSAGPTGATAAVAAGGNGSALPKVNGNGESAGLHALIKEASVRAEREAIDEALVRFRWNRRKAAAYLKVSYKTLLNKMKECGISDPNAA